MASGAGTRGSTHYLDELHPVFGGMEGAVMGILTDGGIADRALVCHGMAVGAWERRRWSSGSLIPL